MSKRKAGRRKQNASSLAIPIVVGVVVLALLVGFMAFSEARRSRSASGPGSAPSAGDTAQPQATRSIPYPHVSRLALQEVKDKLDSGEVMLIDVRSKESFEKSHAVGAVSIPEADIESRLGELPRDKTVVLYCT